MDSADVRIFCEMAFSETGFSTYGKRQVSAASTAKKFGIDEKTVRTRVRNMERSGFIKYYQVTPNPSLFGLRSMGSFRFEALNLATKHGVVEKISSIPHLVEGFDYLGNFVGATFAGSTSADVADAAESLAGRFELDKMELGERAVREPLSRLDVLDWQIIRELRFDARAKMKEIAQELKLTPRMVEYRSSKLVTSGAILIRAVIDAKKQAGLVFFEVEVSIDEDEQSAVIRKIKEVHGDRLWKLGTPTRGRLIASFFGFSIGEPEDVTLQIREMQGVKTSFPFILKEVIEPKKPSWVDNLIDDAIGKPSP